MEIDRFFTIKSPADELPFLISMRAFFTIHREEIMNELSHDDLQAELDALRQKLGRLEAKHRDSLPGASCARRTRFSSKFLLGALSMVALLTVGGLLYGQGGGDALFIDQNGRVVIGGELQVTGRTGVDTDLKVAGNLSANSIEGLGAVPKGAILMWSGSPAQLPAGWVLCDGTNGRPDLKGRFIVGYDPNDVEYNSLKKTGGEKAHKLTVLEMPAHSHSGQTDSSRLSLKVTGGIGGTHGLAAAHDQKTAHFDHQHSFTTASQGGGAAHENRPPYYVLAYIMYVGG
jgi:microcystin-dependent protein